MRTLTACLVAGLLAAAALAVPVPEEPARADAAGFIPHRKHQPLPGKVVGVLVPDAAGVLGAEGRSGPPDQLCLGTGGGSYRWVYIPVTENPIIFDLQVRAGEKGDIAQKYPKLAMANPASVKPAGVPADYCLVEAEVNGGKGAPADDAFVATSMKRVDGTEAYPLKVAEVMAGLKKRHEEAVRDAAKRVDAVMEESAKAALGDKKATGPRESATLTYVSWLPEKERLVVRFKTRVTDGDYQYGNGIKIDLPPPPPGAPGARRAGGAAPPPPEEPIGARYGTAFGVDYGFGYEVDKNGKVVAETVLKPTAFKDVLPPPPAARPRPFPLPLPPVDPKLPPPPAAPKG